MGVLQDILEWSADRLEWQRDALRRIITQESLTNDDLKELLRLCLAQHQMDDQPTRPPVPRPLEAAHVPAGRGSWQRVQLIGLREMSGVNALAPDQHMSFAPDGMTVIFGFNGSGKSGYARVLRRICRSRFPGDRIFPNVFDTNDNSPPTATVDFRVGGADRSETWQQGEEPARPLSQVSFFDSACAAVHVNQQNELAYTPFGLDVLPALVTACTQLQDWIKERVDEHEAKRPESLRQPRAAEGTAVRNRLAQLSPKSDITEFVQLATLSFREQARLQELRDTLAVDPAVQAARTRDGAKQVGRLTSAARTIAEALSPTALEEIRQAVDDLRTKKKAAKQAAHAAFERQPLSGVGEQVWQELWAAARNYSEGQAYPSRAFPVTDEDARCVLCQQVLGEEARGRLTTFEDFVRRETQQAAKQSAEHLRTLSTELEGLQVGAEAYRDRMTDIPGGLGRKVRRFFRMAWRVRRRVWQHCETEAWGPVPDLPKDPSSELETLREALTRQAADLEAATSDEKRRNLIAELHELEAREWLKGILDDVRMDIALRTITAALDAALRDCNTQGITRTSGVLSSTYVDQTLQDRFQHELDALGAGHLRIGLTSPGAQKGHRQFRIALQTARPDANVADVLSEGEFRCVALAGFLADLSTEHTGSALVFDDPVSSLDHYWRRRVAERLAKEVDNRQVVVFTHDVVFLRDLRAFGRDGNPLQINHLRKESGRAGVCRDDEPWIAMTTRKRVGVLKQELQRARATLSNEGEEAYEPAAQHIYGLLRETWERAVEELLLNGAVIRFGISVETQRLEPIVDTHKEDVDVVEEAMGKASRFLAGHDQASGVGDPIPRPDEIEGDIENLERWRKDMQKRGRQGR